MIDWPNTNSSLTYSVLKHICYVAKLCVNFVRSILINVLWVCKAKNLVLYFLAGDADPFSHHHLNYLLIDKIKIDSLDAHNCFVSFCHWSYQSTHIFWLEDLFYGTDLNDELAILERFSQLMLQLSNFFNKGHFLFLFTLMRVRLIIFSLRIRIGLGVDPGFFCF